MAPFRLGLALASALACLWATFAEAGQLRRADLERFFPAPYMLGEKDDALPIWPIFKQNGTSDELIAYVFESVDLAPIPGFSGTPIDLLVALTPDGAFLEVKVVIFQRTRLRRWSRPGAAVRFRQTICRQIVEAVDQGRAPGAAAATAPWPSSTASPRRRPRCASSTNRCSSPASRSRARSSVSLRVAIPAARRRFAPTCSSP